MFFRINRKMMVQLKAITQMTAYSRARVKLTLAPTPDNDDGTLVSIARAGDFRKWLES